MSIKTISTFIIGNSKIPGSKLKAISHVFLKGKCFGCALALERHLAFKKMMQAHALSVGLALVYPGALSSDESFEGEFASVRWDARLFYIMCLYNPQPKNKRQAKRREELYKITLCKHSLGGFWLAHLFASLLIIEAIRGRWRDAALCFFVLLLNRSTQL